MWDTSKENNVEGQNWGLNIMFDITCDITDFITRSKATFTNALILSAK